MDGSIVMAGAPAHPEPHQGAASAYAFYRTRGGRQTDLVAQWRVGALGEMGSSAGNAE